MVVSPFYRYSCFWLLYSYCCLLKKTTYDTFIWFIGCKEAKIYPLSSSMGVELWIVSDRQWIVRDLIQNGSV